MRDVDDMRISRPGQDVKPNPESIERLIEQVRTSPYPAHMKMRLASIVVDQAVVELEADDRHLQPVQIVHGGVLATVIDTATFWAAFLRLPEKWRSKISLISGPEPVGRDFRYLSVPVCVNLPIPRGVRK